MDTLKTKPNQTETEKRVSGLTDKVAVDDPSTAQNQESPLKALEKRISILVVLAGMMVVVVVVGYWTIFSFYLPGQTELNTTITPKFPYLRSCADTQLPCLKAEQTVPDQADLQDKQSIASLVEKLGQKQGIIVLQTGIYTFQSSFTLPDNITLIVHPQAKIVVKAEASLLIQGRIQGGSYAIFEGGGNVEFPKQTPDPQWFGK